MLERLLASRKRPYTPNRDKLEILQIDLSGSLLTLRLPPHSSIGMTAQDPSSVINIFDPNDYEDNSHLPKFKQGGASYRPIMKRSWGFYGPPWCPNEYGFMSFYINMALRRFV